MNLPPLCCSFNRRQLTRVKNFNGLMDGPDGIAQIAVLLILEFVRTEVGSVEMSPFSESASTYCMTVFLVRPIAFPIVA